MQHAGCMMFINIALKFNFSIKNYLNLKNDCLGSSTNILIAKSLYNLIFNHFDRTFAVYYQIILHTLIVC